MNNLVLIYLIPLQKSMDIVKVFNLLYSCAKLTVELFTLSKIRTYHEIGKLVSVSTF